MLKYLSPRRMELFFGLDVNVMKNGGVLFFLQVLLFKYDVNSEHDDRFPDVTLTTATRRDTTSPKPTTLFRRINVEAHIFEHSNTPIDVFTLGSRRKSFRDSEIWNWDEWCQLQPKAGPCEHNITKYYYNSQLDKCLTFRYGGCDSNRNNFDTELDCERHCKGASFMIKMSNLRPTFCFLQPDVGMCLALIPKYYFDINEKACKKFLYGGCGGNTNRFDTLFSCMQACKRYA